ncbi:hypothetical protein VUR80DRAFT_5598 [Thermomyces stellatus]
MHLFLLVWQGSLTRFSSTQLRSITKQESFLSFYFFFFSVLLPIRVAVVCLTGDVSSRPALCGIGNPRDPGPKKYGRDPGSPDGSAPRVSGDANGLRTAPSANPAFSPDRPVRHGTGPQHHVCGGWRSFLEQPASPWAWTLTRPRPTLSYDVALVIGSPSCPS